MLDGSPLILHHPRDAQCAAIMAIQQDLKVVPTITEADSILLGREPDAVLKGIRSRFLVVRLERPPVDRRIDHD